MKALRRRRPDLVMMVLMIFSIFHRFIVPVSDHPNRSQDLAPFPVLNPGGLLALHRACLSALLYKSIKRMCLFDFDITNVEPEALVSKQSPIKFYNGMAYGCSWNDEDQYVTRFSKYPEQVGAMQFNRGDAKARTNTRRK